MSRIRKVFSSALPGCHTQAKSLDELMERIKEAIELYLEVEGQPDEKLEFIGVQQVTISARRGYRVSQVNNR